MLLLKIGDRCTSVRTLVNLMVRGIRLLLALLLLAALMPDPVSAQAESFPSRTVRLIVPFSAGGPTDITARFVADFLEKKWGQTVIVENRPGGGTVIGTNAVAQAPADGYMLLFGVSSSLVENSFLMRDLPYDPIKSFAPIMEIYKISAGLTVNSNVPANNIAELVALAKSKPLSYSSFGIGTGPHLLLETFKKAAGADILHVPYKGNVAGLAAVVSGEVNMTGAGLGTTRPHVESKKLRLLAVGGDTRSKFEPDVPTFKELGYPDVGAGSQFVALWAPAGTPEAVVAKVNRDVAEALAMPQFAAFLDKYAYDKASATTPQQLESLARASLERWGPVIKSLGIKIGN